MPKSRKTCCIKGCFNRQDKQEKGLINESVSLFRIPKASVVSKSKQRELWIREVIKYNKLSHDWEPSNNVYICGKHFVGGKPFNHPLHPAYIPTIFNDDKKKEDKMSKDVERFNRRIDRENKKETKNVYKKEPMNYEISMETDDLIKRFEFETAQSNP